MLLTGRRRIYTDEPEIDENNIIPVLRESYYKHSRIAYEIQSLINFDRGIQPLMREKKVRPEIDIRVTDNIANYIKEYNLDYFWSSPIMLIQRGQKEPHDTNPTIDNLGIVALNEMLKNGVNTAQKDLTVGEFVEICGIGHSLVDIKTDFRDDVLFWNSDGQYVGPLVNVYALDSRYAFCIYYNGIGEKKLMGVTYTMSNGKIQFTCFTDKYRFEISEWEIQLKQINPMKAVPIVEFNRSYDRTGCFERSISEMNSLNIMVSDFTNDVAQRTQEIWWGNNVDFPKDEKTGKDIKPQSGQWLLTYSDEKKIATVKPLTSTVDNAGTLSAICKQRNWILQKNNVPLQYDSSGGGSTGVATDVSSGWSRAESAAMKKQQIIDKAKREELNLILRAISLVPLDILPGDNPIRKVHSTDVEFHYNRRKNYDLSTKANFVSTMLDAGWAGDHVLAAAEIFPDNAQVWQDSKDMVTAIQKLQLKDGAPAENDRNMPDLSDQTDNSPILNGVGG